MKKRKAYRIFLIYFLVVSVLFAVFYVFYLINHSIPDRIYLVEGEDYKLKTGLPMSAAVEADSMEAAYYISDSQHLNTVKITSGERKTADNIGIKGIETGKCNLKLKLFGVFNVADVEIQVVEKNMVYPGGQPIGIYLDTDGVMVIGTGEIFLEDGSSAEPAYGIINSGDYIISVDNTDVSTKEELTGMISESEGRDIILKVRRNNKEVELKITPQKCNDGKYRAGIWVRDDTQGIGTLTFMTMDGRFAALGHGISDVDTSQLIEVEKGALYDAYVYEIIKGATGKPGSLVGSINYSENTFEGYIYANTDVGIYGRIENSENFKADRDPVNIGFRQEVTEGDAEIICNVNGEVGKYKIRIDKLDYNSKNNKNMVIEVTDEKLLELTGGIVQGMSGSPILQNGKLVGAITHVMVNNPTRGYGIFIETMMDSCE